ncbi:hypothetical protein C2G38_2217556 [Gigaspora rosea]|uniref:Uncharacterized protein n=1 Tax=Gigaspora rosea TaxID=44941 RepID=A0A397U7M6_9GLOM|nr:hypothetical protein C2G38_2217556 [Gigaspora rosea]
MDIQKIRPLTIVNKTSKKCAHQYTSFKESISISNYINLHDDQIETISLCNEDENHATNQAQDITSSNTQFSMLKPLQLTSNPNILSPNITLLSPNPNTSDLDILSLSPDIIPLSSKSKPKKKQMTTVLSDNSDNKTTFWPNSTIKSLLAYLSDNMLLYRMNKNKFYLRATMHLGKGKTEEQVSSKLQRLITKYMDESSNKTEQDRSLKSNKKRRLNENEIHYIKSMDIITESKKVKVETRKKHFDLEKEKFEYEREKEKERFKFERKKWEYEKQMEKEKIDLEKYKYKLELEYRLQLELKTKELELKYKHN